MDRNWTKSLFGWTTKGLLSLAVAGTLWSAPAVHAAAPSLDTIRVAMFLDLGSQYKSTTNAVTLKSAEALTASLLASGAQQTLMNIPANQQVRMSVDTYRVKVLETADWKTASEAAKKLQATNDKPMLFADGSVYKLYAGMYGTEKAAVEAAARTAKTAAAYLNGQKPSVKGGLHLSAGSYRSEAEAESVRKTYADAGMDAFNVVVPNGGSSAYEVWVGEAANTADLTAIKLEAAAISGSLVEQNGATPGLIVRRDVSLNLATPQESQHYMLSGDQSVLRVEGSSGAGTNVKERSDRSYRGALEIGQKNGQLYLVNELPFQQYLYSVVGAEVPSTWGAEALKAQAVAARSYALFQGNKFEVAHVVDTTLSQAYYGTAYEYPSIIQAVDATDGEVVMKDGKIVETVFSSNSGGMTADSTEVWGNRNDLFAAVESPGDSSSQAALKSWYHVLLPSGITGYVREDNVKETGNKTSAGLLYMTVTAKDTNVRPLPLIQSNVEPVGKMNPGETAVVLEKVAESNSYDWVRGPYTSDQLLASLKGKTSNTLPASITSLDVTERGPSGRALTVKANGQVLDVKYPDMFRSAFNGLPSTLFDIESTGSYTVLSANGAVSTVSSGQTVSVISGSGNGNVKGSGTVVMNGTGKARVIESSSGFKFTGKGFGHGLGMSQWGAKGMADEGYDYKQILQHYYRNTTITKD
ncbi:SpoIID/LytB domain-containing protein [Paenibacillus lautus]|uniref:SpoIID/LytB domain-containing protein n=1 Tax=Paenibacillus lautus TaxID=1401 RepID=UPI002DBC76BB|nr:SpoIID/LytB domain-containing protein [Paenibacillus lautus]MEC0305988.1 SpoIID/LytB domain-containing protein [Paenibacillus lautus]